MDQAKLTNIKVLAITIVMLHAAILFFVIPRLSPQVSGAYIPKIFGDGYDQLAENLANGNGYRFYPDTALTLMREPGYPILLAGLTKAFGASFTVVKISNMILAIATAWLLMLIGIRLMPRGAAQNTLSCAWSSSAFSFSSGSIDCGKSRRGRDALRVSNYAASANDLRRPLRAIAGRTICSAGSC